MFTLTFLASRQLTSTRYHECLSEKQIKRKKVWQWKGETVYDDDINFIKRGRGTSFSRTLYLDVVFFSLAAWETREGGKRDEPCEVGELSRTCVSWMIFKIVYCLACS